MKRIADKRGATVPDRASPDFQSRSKKHYPQCLLTNSSIGATERGKRPLGRVSYLEGMVATGFETLDVKLKIRVGNIVATECEN